MVKKKIFIAGGAGYIGTRFCNTFCDDYDITVLDYFWFGDNIKSEKVTKIYAGISELDVDDLRGYDAVMFLGGLSNDPMAEFNPNLNFVENSAVPTYLAYLTKTAGVKKFIGASSCSVYGFTKNKTLVEKSDVKPTYPYGVSKLQFEKGISILEDKNFKPILFRKGTVGGWSERMRYDLVVNTMLMTALTKKKITINSPKLWRPLIDIRDVVEAYRLALESDEDISGVFNLSGVNLTIGTLGKLIHKKLKQSGFEIDLEILNIKDFRNYKVNIDKIQDELQFEPKYLPKDSLDEILENIDINTYDFSNKKYYNIEVFKELRV
jgi:nucleoside-diphosphate-sugar epimerase